ncbi:phage antirepressor KilAC domain-containing protein [Luteipulveratus halotolerans]|uniref:Uncharacterized protein n=1 Tax=Luteipulveratus halotolerans TaxID=1631356 RepID=A0A0L6CJT8_9MICO|nr:phage antirepressor KilAC domain-containing protein [Luteipulveratus halotolerans]KNX38061.1 hypothetical protein VV01_14385 [Luteipulveratus halotolerans]
MYDVQPTGPRAVSPFDSIRQTREDGSEFWSARDLMPLLGYDKWERFEGSVERAKQSAMAQGNNAVDHFPGAGKVIEGGRWGQQTVADYSLTRFACYLVAMNGDPRKAEVAAAQAYFAVRTREAETTPPRELSFEEMTLRVITESQERIQALQGKVAELEPKAEIADNYLLSKPNGRLVREVAKTLNIKETALRAFLLEEGLIFRRQSLCGSLTYDFKAEYRAHFEAKATVVNHNFGACDHYTLYVTPRGVDLIRKRIADRKAAIEGALP